MKRIGSLLLSSVKYAAYLGSITMVGGAAFLGYINSKIGGIEINKDETTKYYHETLGMDKGEAARMYYWLLWDIGMMRVLTYGSYTTYCQRLNKKIINVSLQNYQKSGILKDIKKAEKVQGVDKNKRLIFTKMQKVRKSNFQNIETYQYIVKQIRKQQQLMDCRTIIGLGDEGKSKIDLVHKFLCDIGIAIEDKEIRRYMEQVPGIQARFPGDYIHKILVI